MRTTVVAMLVVVGLAACSEGWAMCGGGGMVRGGGIRGGMRSGGVRVTGGGGAKKVAPKPVDKVDMPAAVEIARLDSSFDRLLSAIELNSEQQKKIAAAKAELAEAAKKLEKAQADARAAYLKASTESAYREAAQNVLAAMNLCREFQPNKKFEVVLSSVLTHEQRTKLKELSRKS
jgi:hypothetical protein